MNAQIQSVHMRRLVYACAVSQGISHDVAGKKEDPELIE